MRILTSIALIVASVTVPFAIAGLITLTLKGHPVPSVPNDVSQVIGILELLAVPASAAVGFSFIWRLAQRYPSVMTRGVLIFTAVVYFPLMYFYLMMWLLERAGGI